MSERYGPCLRCGGRGQILVDEVLLRYEDCGRCEGTGQGGTIDELYAGESRLKPTAKEEAEHQQRMRRAKDRAAAAVESVVRK